MQQSLTLLVMQAKAVQRAEDRYIIKPTAANFADRALLRVELERQLEHFRLRYDMPCPMKAECAVAARDWCVL